MNQHLVVTGELTQSSVGAFLDPLSAPDLDVSASDAVVLDMAGVRFVKPAPVVALAAILERVCANKFRPVILLPESYDCRRYLATNGFVSALASVADFEAADDVIALKPSGDSDTVLPLTYIAGTDEIPPLLRGVERRIDDMLGTSDDGWERSKRPILSTIRELCENVFQHAGKAPGWIAAQRYQNRWTGKPYLELAIGDAGRGIRRSLATSHTELLKASDGDALERMLAEGLSRLEQPYRGNGYYVLQLATKELDGSFHLRSGTAALVRPRRGSIQRRDELAWWPGTQLQVTLTCA
jgi:hypothetical protein